MPKMMDKSRDQMRDNNEDTSEALHELVVDVLATVIEEDSESEENIRSAVRDIVTEKFGDLDDAIRTELGERIDDLDLGDIKEEAVKQGVSRVLEKIKQAA